MSRTPRRPASLRGKIFRARTAHDADLLTPTELRSAAWRPLFRGIYADATLPITHRHRCAAVSNYLLPADGAIAGRSAASLYGAGSPADTDPVEVVVPRTARFGPVIGLRIHSADLTPEEVRERNGIRLTTPLRTCWDLVQWLDVVEAVVLLDLLVRRRLVTVARLAAYARSNAGRRGCRRMSRAAGLVDPAAESPQESRLRVRLVLAGLPRPVVQFVVERAGAFVARVDLAWPELRVAVEYDGTWHAAEEQIHHDRRRLNKLLGLDWVVLHVTAKRMREDFDDFVAELRAALLSRRCP
jgi:very-short-patch-repair endonuclease